MAIRQQDIAEMYIPQELETIKQSKRSPPAFDNSPDALFIPAMGFGARVQRHLPPATILALQQTRGNRAVCRMLGVQRRAIIRREPDAGDPDDEQQETTSPADGQSSTTTLPAGSSPPDAEPLAAGSSSDDSAAADETPQAASSQADVSSTGDSSTTTDSDVSTDSGPVIGGPVEGEAAPIEVEANGGCDDLDLQGLTTASYGGNFGTSAIAYTNVGSDVRATGTITGRYTVGTQVTLPSPPDGLSDCETGKVNNGIQTVLAPHEQRHVRAFNGFAGNTVRPFSLTLTGMNTSAGAAALDAAVQPLLQGLFDSEKSTRQNASDTASAALDPFHFTVDCSDCN